MELTNIKILTFAVSITIVWGDCVNYDYVCKAYRFGIKYQDPNIKSVNSSDYRGCIDHCFQYPACKVFEFDPIEGVCRFSSVFFDYTKAALTSMLLWKKTSGISCKEHLTEGMSFFL